jgi:hypothetical protein
MSSSHASWLPTIACSSKKLANKRHDTNAFPTATICDNIIRYIASLMTFYFFPCRSARTFLTAFCSSNRNALMMR